MYKEILVLTALIVFFVPSRAADIYVPDQYPTIQDAINLAVSGDTVIVRPGTYVENIDFIGKYLTVKSEFGPDATVIDGNQTGSVVTFQSGEDFYSVLYGFTITNGNNGSGGGILCHLSDPTIANNVITGNSSSYGGGIHCYGSDPVIEGNRIFWDNSAQSGPEIWIGKTANPSTVTLNYSDVKGGQASIYVDPGCTLQWGQGMIDLDPLFVDAAVGDFHLPLGSPCRNGGVNAAPAIPGSGVLTLSATVPSFWSPGSLHPFQALVGPWGGVNTQLTNLMVLSVE